MTEHSPEQTRPSLVRRSTFRASLRKMAKFRPWESADERQVHRPNGQEVEVVRLPVVSIYSVREDAVMKRRVRDEENLSPASRRNVDRLVKRFGPEVLEIAKKRQLAKRKPLETIVPEVVVTKRRCSTGNIHLAVDCQSKGTSIFHICQLVNKYKDIRIYKHYKRINNI